MTPGADKVRKLQELVGQQNTSSESDNFIPEDEIKMFTLDGKKVIGKNVTKSPVKKDALPRDVLHKDDSITKIAENVKAVSSLEKMDERDSRNEHAGSKAKVGKEIKELDGKNMPSSSSGEVRSSNEALSSSQNSKTSGNNRSVFESVKVDTTRIMKKHSLEREKTNESIDEEKNRWFAEHNSDSKRMPSNQSSDIDSEGIPGLPIKGKHLKAEVYNKTYTMDKTTGQLSMRGGADPLRVPNLKQSKEVAEKKALNKSKFNIPDSPASEHSVNSGIRNTNSAIRAIAKKQGSGDSLPSENTPATPAIPDASNLEKMLSEGTEQFKDFLNSQGQRLGDNLAAAAHDPDAFNPEKFPTPTKDKNKGIEFPTSPGNSASSRESKLYNNGKEGAVNALKKAERMKKAVGSTKPNITHSLDFVSAAHLADKMQRDKKKLDSGAKPGMDKPNFVNMIDYVNPTDHIYNDVLMRAHWARRVTTVAESWKQKRESGQDREGRLNTQEFDNMMQVRKNSQVLDGRLVGNSSSSDGQDLFNVKKMSTEIPRGLQGFDKLYRNQSHQDETNSNSGSSTPPDIEMQAPNDFEHAQKSTTNSPKLMKVDLESMLKNKNFTGEIYEVDESDLKRRISESNSRKNSVSPKLDTPRPGRDNALGLDGKPAVVGGVKIPGRKNSSSPINKMLRKSGPE